MNTKILLGMPFDMEDLPDFGSLYLVKSGQNNVNDYGGNSTDVEKLDLITWAAPGSTCLFDDTGDIYRLTLSGWVLLGGSSEDSDDTDITPSVEPLSLGNDTLGRTVIDNTNEPSVELEDGERQGVEQQNADEQIADDFISEDMR